MRLKIWKPHAIYDAKQQYKKAAKYYQAAYKSVDITGDINLAQLYLDGKGVKLGSDTAKQALAKLN